MKSSWGADGVGLAQCFRDGEFGLHPESNRMLSNALLKSVFRKINLAAICKIDAGSLLKIYFNKIKVAGTNFKDPSQVCSNNIKKNWQLFSFSIIHFNFWC